MGGGLAHPTSRHPHKRRTTLLQLWAVAPSRVAALQASRARLPRAPGLPPALAACQSDRALQLRRCKPRRDPLACRGRRLLARPLASRWGRRLSEQLTEQPPGSHQRADPRPPALAGGRRAGSPPPFRATRPTCAPLLPSLQACGAPMQASHWPSLPWQRTVAAAGALPHSCAAQAPVKQAVRIRPARLGSSDTPFIGALFAQVRQPAVAYRLLRAHSSRVWHLSSLPATACLLIGLPP